MNEKSDQPPNISIRPLSLFTHIVIEFNYHVCQPSSVCHLQNQSKYLLPDQLIASFIQINPFMHR